MKTFDQENADKLNAIFAATRNLTFSKNIAAKIVGGRYELERLVGERKIKAEKPSLNQNGKWLCNAADVLRHAVDPMYRRTRKK